MADRYWVGGTGTWDTTSTTNWSASSGGASGASVPTAADNVFFDQNTTYTVTLTGALACLSINVSQGTVTFTSSGTLAVSGSFTVKSGTVWNANGNITFNATTSQTITTNAVVINANIIVDGAGGTITLGSALTCVGLTVTNGTFSTSASNYNFTGTITISANSNTKVLTLNASTVTSSSFTNNSTGNFTLNAGTSTLICAVITGGVLTFYNLSVGNIGSAFEAANYVVGALINGSTFNNGTFTASNGRTNGIYFSGNVTFNGTLTVTGSNPWDRFLFSSNVAGTSRTITAATVSLANVDFQDITGAGAASWTGTGIGDGGGNSGITFPAAKTVYYKATTLGDFNSANWATTSGGATSSANYPLLQDIAVIDNNSGTGTLNSFYIAIGNITFANRTTAMTWNPCPTFEYKTGWMGDVILSSSVTVTSSGYGITVRPRANNVINTAGQSISVPLYFQSAPSGSRDWSVSGNSSLSGGFVHQFGTLKLGSSTLTLFLYSSNNSDTRTLDFGTGKIVLNGTGTIWNTSTITNLTISGTPVVDVNNNTATAATISPGALSEANSISFNFVSGTYALTLNSNYRNVNFTGFSGTLGNQARTVYGDWTASTGMTLSAGANALTFAATSGSKTITSNGKTFDFPITFNGAGGTWVFQDNLTVGSTRIFTHTNGTVDLNGKSISVGSSYATAAGTKNLTFNGGTLVCANSGSTAFNNAQPTGFTTTAGTGTGKISMTSASAKTFVGGGSTYNCTLSNDGAGALTISGSNTFTTLANGVQPTTFTFTSGTTTTVTNWNISGTSGNLVTIGSTTTSQHTLSKSSGVVSANYLSVSYSNATGGASWYAGANSTDGGNNSGWLFSNAPVVPGNFFLMFN